MKHKFYSYYLLIETYLIILSKYFSFL
ncbi:hypothetical protein LJP_1119 [Lactobacillus johnsonii DPC 6026]|nr:hypothetical protein LJP_1119 [Lactobacillus johnsonii DPC 6026]